jgi:tetratricopeptide (TPR) repeat protein
MKLDRFAVLRYAVVFLFVLSSQLLLAQVPPGLTERTATEFGGRHSITGMILLPSGRSPSERIRIRLVSPGRDVVTTTDESGRFLISGLPDGGYTIYVDPPEKYQPHSESIELVPATLAGGGQTYRVQIRLRDAARTPTHTGVVDADLASVPKSAVAHYEKAGERAVAGDTKAAVEHLLSAVAEYPEFFLAHSELGVQYQKLNELEKADHHLQKALKIKPGAFEPLANRGIILVRLRRYSEAERVLREAIKIKDSSAVVNFYLGRSLLGQNRPDDAEPVFKTAFDLGGNEMIEARRALATIFLGRGENEKALVEIEAYLTGNPKAYDAAQLQETAAKIREWLKTNAKP